MHSPPWGPRLLCFSPSSNEDHLSSLCLSPCLSVACNSSSLYLISHWFYLRFQNLFILSHYSLSLPRSFLLYVCVTVSCSVLSLLLIPDRFRPLYASVFIPFFSLKLPHSCLVSSEPAVDHQCVRLEAKSVFVWGWERDGFSPELFPWKRLWGLLQVRITRLHLSQVVGPEHRIVEVFLSAYW